MRQEDRLGLILQQLNEHGSVGVATLADTFGVSEASVRRDLQLLEKQKLLTRTHGGAVASGVLYELPMRYRGGQHYAAKRAIAAKAMEILAPDAASVGLNGGSTTTEVARALAATPQRPGGHQRAQHRLRTRCALEHRARGVRRQRARRVLRVGRPAGRDDAVEHQSRRRRSSAWTA